MSKHICYQIYIYNIQKRLPLCIFGKLANVLFRNFVTTNWEHFYALIQRTDGCLDVQWLLVQPNHSIHCSYKLYTNRHLSQHMIFSTVKKTQVSLCKCTDSPEPSLLRKQRE